MAKKAGTGFLASSWIFILFLVFHEATHCGGLVLESRLDLLLTLTQDTLLPLSECLVFLSVTWGHGPPSQWPGVETKIPEAQSRGHILKGTMACPT